MMPTNALRTFPAPIGEQRRLDLLTQYEVFGTAPEPEYDQITKLAAELMGFPICLVSIVGHDEQWLKSRWGLDVVCTPRSVAFCAHTIMSHDLFIVPDALEDARFATNPLVIGAPHVRFYAGAPLITAQGAHIGALCLIDQNPRSFSDEEANLLRRLADIVVERFDQRRHALVTRAEHRDAFATSEAQRMQLQRAVAANDVVRDQMLSITTSIDGIAKRLKLIAINARIEAAHAGSAGRAFAIVADEVKQLAEHAASQISTAKHLLD